ncbi:MAG: restriction endonuclease subunit S [Polyangiales bacterium]
MSAQWPVRKLGELAEVLGGGTPSRNEPSYFGGSIPFVTPTDLPPQGVIGVLAQTEETLTDAGLRSCAARLLPTGTVLFSSRASIGKVAIVATPCCTNQGFANFVPNPALIDPRFLAYAMIRYTDDIGDLAGNTTFKEVPRGKLRNFELSVPPLAEQRRIVAKLDSVMPRAADAQRLATEREELRAALPVAWVSERVAAFRARSNERTLGEVVAKLSGAMASGPFGSQLLHEEFVSDGHLVIGIANVQEHRFNPVRKWMIDDAKLAEMGRFRVAAGDVLVTVMGTVGRCCVVPEDIGTAVTSKHVYRVRVPQNVLRPLFLSALINFDRATREALLGEAIGGVMPGLNGSKLKALRVPVPPLRDQDELTSGLERVLAMRESDAGVGAEEVNALRAAILRRAFAREL